MSLLHKPTYTNKYSKQDDAEGLRKLNWSQFMCKCGNCDVGSGKRLMEKLAVTILDEIAQEERIRFDIELGYVCKVSADKNTMISDSPHRAGLGVRIRVLNPMKRMLLIRGLIVRGVTRIGVNKKFVYYDIDDLKKMGVYFN